MGAELASVGVVAALGGLLGLWLAPVTGMFVPYPDEETVVPPPPQCPTCGTIVPWSRWSPVPPRLFSRAPCPHCHHRARGDVLVPLLLAATFAALAVRFDVGFELVAFGFLAAVLVPVAVIDARVHRLPDRLVLPAYPVAFLLLGLAALWGGPEPLLGAGAGLVGLTAIYGLVGLLFGRGIGGGDIKIVGLLGAYLGWTGIINIVVAFYLWSFLSAGYGVAAATYRWRVRPEPTGWRVALREARGTVVPLGPFMAVGTLGAVIAGPWTARTLSALLP
ncbi:prepilin peptidase [Spiractinospora alimapuensis]|uniref:prepilin peptidase n=1 Tax=Spiractinospora alimapuensis TaxID=2820884 RepID=UPI001F3A61F3|nr:A24 family peptidase [Spiractinospora alimapuensis]QVQ53150.1 prepilin peptidase [Spiractinospora alimapuensis]